MKIAQWMKHPVITVKPADSTRHARQLRKTWVGRGKRRRAGTESTILVIR